MEGCVHKERAMEGKNRMKRDGKIDLSPRKIADRQTLSREGYRMMQKKEQRPLKIWCKMAIGQTLAWVLDVKLWMAVILRRWGCYESSPLENNTNNPSFQRREINTPSLLLFELWTRDVSHLGQIWNQKYWDVFCNNFELKLRHPASAETHKRAVRAHQSPSPDAFLIFLSVLWLFLSRSCISVTSDACAAVFKNLKLAVDVLIC